VPRMLTCSGGHSWEESSSGAACPACGEPPLGPEPDAATEANPTGLFEPGRAAPAVADVPAIPGYEILGVLGRGGMGVVYQARQVRANRVVAVKMLPPGAQAGDTERTRFRAEVEAVARLQHPGIVQVFEIGEVEGRPFFSMEYCPGGSLAGKLAGTPLPAGEAARLTAALARGVAAAHAAGIVHRDLKPANVLFAADAAPKIADFGLAKRIDDESGHTRTGSILGTPSYMAPEQALGESKRVGPAADVYALGAILYECLTGRPPFKGASVLETLEQVRSQEPVPVRQLQPAVSRDLETIALKCLRKQPDRRYASAADLADDLERFLDGRPILARPVGRIERAWRWGRRNPVGAALVASLVLGAALAAGLAVWAFRERDRANEKAAVADAAAVATRRYAEHSHVAAGIPLENAGDLPGALLWYVKPFKEDHGPIVEDELHRIRLGAYLRYGPRLQLSRVLAQPELRDSTDVSFGPDGRRVAAHYVAFDEKEPQRNGSGVVVWDLAAADPAPRELNHPGGAHSFDFDPSGDRIVTFGGDGTARVWDAATGAPAGAAMGHPGRANHGIAAFLPDGKHIVTVRRDPDAAGDLRLWDAATRRPVGDPLPLSASRLPVTSSADARRWADLADGKTVRVFDAATRQLAGPPLVHDETVRDLRFSPDGERLSVRVGKSAHVWDVATGKPVVPPVASPRGPGMFTPDGRLFLSAEEDGVARLWDLATGKPLWAQGQKVELSGPAAISPDGRWFVPRNDVGNTTRVWNLRQGRPAGGLLSHALRTDAGPKVAFAAFSRDGRRLLTVGDTAYFVWDLAQDRPTGAPLPLPAGTRAACFSPDGERYLALDAAGARVRHVATGAAAGPPLEQFEPGEPLRFHANGRHVYLDDLGKRDKGGRTLRAWDGTTGRRTVRPFALPAEALNLDLVPDGRKVVVALGPINGPEGRGEAQIYDGETGQPVGPRLTHKGPVLNAYFSPDGRRVVTCSWDRTARVWDAATGEPISPPLEHEGEVNQARFSPDGRRLVAGGMSGAARLWDTATWRPIGDPLSIPRVESVTFLAYSPDGRRILTGSLEGSGIARLWDAETGRPAGLPLNAVGVGEARFTADSRRVLTIADGGVGVPSARLWDATTGHPVGPELAIGTFLGVGFSPDGHRLVAPGPDGARVWDLSPDRRPAADLVAYAEVFAGYRHDPFGTRVEMTAHQQRDALRHLQARYPNEFAAPRK